MGDEEKELTEETEPVEASSTEEPTIQEPEAPAVVEETIPKETNALAEKRGRMVAAGLIAAVILSLIAVLVAGIFQFTSRLLAPCPTDLPVNDPAPILWKNITSTQVIPQSLGVSGNAAGDVKLKEAPISAGESAPDAATGQNK